MKTKMLAMALLAGGSAFAQTRVQVGVGVGNVGGYYQQGPSYAAAIPPSPGPGYVWVDGYWADNYGQSVWVPGYWSLPVVNNGYYGSYSSGYYGGAYYGSGYYGGGYYGGGYYGGYPSARYGYRDRDDHRGSNRGVEQGRNNFSGQNRGSNFGSGQQQQQRNSGQGQVQNQNRGAGGQVQQRSVAPTQNQGGGGGGNRSGVQSNSRQGGSGNRGGGNRGR